MRNDGKKSSRIVPDEGTGEHHFFNAINFRFSRTYYCLLACLLPSQLIETELFFSPLKSALIIFVLSFFFFLSPLPPSRRCLDRFEKNRAKSLWSRNHFLIARRKWFESNHWICAWNASKQDWIDTWRDTLFESFRRNRGTDYRTRKSDAGGDASTPAGHIKQYITDFIFHEQQTWTTVKQKLKV